ncbi:MAG: response regulator [Leptolyngbyaceae cyanobacterium]
MAPPSILVIDDEPDNFDVIEALLSRQDYQLHYAESGETAIASLDAFQPDLILLDVMMPGIDGIEVCRQIKALPRWQLVPIIMVTALSARSDLAHCLIAGADDFISKPVNGMELLARVQSMLRIKHQYDQIQSLSQVQANTIACLQQNLTELQGNLAANLAHELNTPLNGILGSLTLLQNHFDAMERDGILKLINITEQSARRLETLTQKSLIYLELELVANQQKKLDATPTRLSGYVLQAELEARAQRYNRSGDLVFNLATAWIPLPERYLSILFHELVDNALKFSPKGTPITVSSQIEDKQIRISIQDLGCGMTADQIAKVDAFRQFGRSIYEQQGMGIGLKLAQKMTTLVGGEMTLQSNYQHNMTVTLALPTVTA